jgi:D-inositol-3-phosphate glycosyltransferase
MKPAHVEDQPHESDSTEQHVRAQTRELGRQFGEDYFALYGRGPSGYETTTPYRDGAPQWQTYFGRIADLIVSEIGPKTVLDAGCAIGFLVDALRQRNVEAWGIDISEYAIRHVPERVRAFCWTDSVTDELDRDYDLIVCLEVLEHLPPHLAPIAIGNFSRHTNGVVFSASPDGFRDPTHLNVRPTDYWVELFGRHGFFRNLDLDASVVAPQAIHFVRAGQTAVSIARAYEKWHWNTRAELSDLRAAARQIGNDALVRAERYEMDVATLAARVDTLKTAAAQSADELAPPQHARRFRYPARMRSLYARSRLLLHALLHRMSGANARQPLAEPAVRYSIDAPKPGQNVEPDLLIPVYGWVISKQGPVARVEVSVNGTAVGRARLGLARPDVAAHFDTPHAPMSGFETLIDLAAVPVDTNIVTIELTAETLDGDRHALAPVDLALWDVPPSRVPLQEAPLPEIRLLVFAHDLGLGGGQLYLFELLRLLSRSADLAVTLVAPADGPLREAIRGLGIRVLINGPHPVTTLAEYDARQEELKSWARRGHFNSVLANTLGTFPGVDLAERLDLPAVWAIHESFDLRSFWRAGYGSPDAVHPLVKAHGESALASAAAVVFEADATRELFVRHGDPSRFVTVPYGIDIEGIDEFAASVSRAEARRRLQLPTDATILLCLGTVEPRKGQAALAAAFSVVAANYADVVLAFVGAGSDAPSSALRSFVDKSDLGPSVRIVPITPDIYLWYRAADALVCASDVESLPRTVLESMAFSVPVLATRVFGLPELIDDGVTGYLCEPRDIDELVQILKRFLDSTVEEREAIGAAGARLVHDRHDSRGYAAAYHRLVRSLIEDPSRSPSEILARD